MVADTRRLGHHREDDDDDEEPPPLVHGNAFGSFGGFGGGIAFSNLGSLGGRGLIAREAQALSRTESVGSSDEDQDDDPILTYEECTRLQRELRDQFQIPTFQAKLKALKALDVTPTEFAQKRQNLMLEVQRLILPRYGFEGSRVGVFKMMAAMGPYVERPEFVELASEINSLLGLRSPPQTWQGLSRACARAAEDQATAEQSYTSRARPIADIERGVPSNRWLGKDPPMKLSVAGSWRDFVPDVMEWYDGSFAYPLEIGSDGWECFQLLKDGSWDAVIYPSIEEAGSKDQFEIRGPAKDGNGNWQIGKFPEEEAAPGVFFVIKVTFDASGKVEKVWWEKL